MDELELEYTCECTTKHVPKPVVFIEREGKNLCPTTACNLDHLLLEWYRHAGEPPGSITKHYSAFVRSLARSIVREEQDGASP